MNPLGGQNYGEIDGMTQVVVYEGKGEWDDNEAAVCGK